MAQQDIFVTPQDLDDQREIMVEEYDVPEEKAEEIFEDTKTYVMLQSQELGKDWDSEVIEAVTNLLISVQRQVSNNRYRRKQQFYARVYNLVSASIVGVGAASLALMVYIGNWVPAGILAFGFLCLIVSHIRNA